MIRYGALKPSPLDSARFGLKISRAALETCDERTLLRTAVDGRVDVAIIRLPTESSTTIQKVQRRGFPVLHADTLVYYSIDLRSYEPKPLRNANLEFSLATTTDRAEIEALVRQTFASYRSHYHANPLFDAGAILDGYMEWASGHIDAVGGSLCWVARRAGRIVAFACCDEGEDFAEGVLYGVHPDCAGGGLYSDLIRFTQAQFKSRGAPRMHVSTQVGNYAVQKVWAREGFALDAAYDTFHVNLLLSAGECVAERTLRFGAADVQAFAELSGDTNALHFDDAAAKAAGFEGRITHGMLAAAQLSQLFGVEVPGPGTIYLRQDLVFFQPLYPDRDYRLSVRFPAGAPGARPALAVATVENGQGELCLLGYADLMQRGR